MDINKQLENYKKLNKKLSKEKEALIEMARSQGFEFDEKTCSLIRNEEEVYVMDLYIRSETAYESSGYYLAYAGLIQIPESYFMEIKGLITKNKEDWEEMFQLDSYFEIDEFEGFRRAMDYLPLEYISVDEIGNIFLADDMSDANEKREGIIEFYGEMYFGDEHSDGYVSIFKMNKAVYERNKHEQKFENTKYIMENTSFEYK